MTINIKTLFLLVAFGLALTSCGGGGPSFDGSAGSLVNATSNTSKASKAPSSTAGSLANTASSVNSALLQKGKTFYEQQCAICHDSSVAGLDGAGLFKINIDKFASVSLLATYIAANMPQGNVGNCVGDCADGTAAFIWNGYVIGSNAGAISSGATNVSSTATSATTNTPAIPQGLQKITPVTIHRLNRNEYNNTVRDLLGTQLKPADTFPEDDFGYGFNNIADVLSTSLVHVEQYEAATNTLLIEALGGAVKPVITEYKLINFGGANGGAADDIWVQYANGTVTVPVTVATAGLYTLTIVAGQHAGGPDNANLGVSLNGVLLKNIGVAAPSTKMLPYLVDAQLGMGVNNIQLAFTNDYYVANTADRDLVLDTLEVSGPMNAGEKLAIAPFRCGPALVDLACARDILQNFGLRAWRRPLTAVEISDLSAIYDFAKEKGASHTESLRATLKALLLSSNFIYRPEPSANSAAATPLNAYELASRLSYFLWSSMPDDKLFELAANNTLLDKNVLSGEVLRMLDDVKSASLIENFAVQWLKFDRVSEVSPDLKLFPTFDRALVAAMRQETRLFLREILKNNLSVNSLFTADFTYLNPLLAQHYGVTTEIKGDVFQRHVWGSGDPHRGILGQASVLTATSHSTSTSPVLRGKWVLENLLCDEPPPPPPGVENIAEKEDVKNLSTRQRFEAHSKSGSTCVACHQAMDPIGFGLENFNIIGQFRTMDLQHLVDAAGKLPTGETFSGSVELGNILARSYRLPMCTTEHLLTYALGRGVDALGYGGEKPDYPAVYDIYQKTAASGHKIRDIINQIVLSDLFMKQAAFEAAVGGAQ